MREAKFDEYENDVRVSLSVYTFIQAEAPRRNEASHTVPSVGMIEFAPNGLK